MSVALKLIRLESSAMMSNCAPFSVGSSNGCEPPPSDAAARRPCWFRKSGARIEVFHRSVDTGIVLYEIAMEPIPAGSPYGRIRTFFVNLVRKHSALGALLNQDALEGYAGSAAMIDYILRFPGHLNGPLDKKFMVGSTDSVRSRVRIVQDELFVLARSCLTRTNRFRLFEVGPGYLRTQLDLLRRLKEAGCDTKAVEMVGVDSHPRVVRAASRIIEHEGVADVVTIHQGDALTWLTGSNGKYDVALAEGVFEYADMVRSVELASALSAHLEEGGHLIASATHRVPKKALIEYLDIRVLERSREELLEIFRRAGFDEPRLIATDPPNVSVGIGRSPGGE
jgi:protein-L-isoaspartate O-methyltransferase